MKKYMSILILIFTIFAFGCSNDNNIGAKNYIEIPYTIQHAYENNDVIDIQNGNKSYNTERLEEFINGKIKKVRIVSYHMGLDDKFDWENPEMIYDLSNDGKEIILSRYSTHSIPSDGRITKTSSDRFTSIGKDIKPSDMQYIVYREKKVVVILSLVKNGFIDDVTREYLDNMLKNK